MPMSVSPTSLDSQKRMMLRAVRGSPSTIILAMLFFPNLHGEAGLASASGMNRKTVRKCLYDLESLGFVLRGGRYEAWILAPGVRQMVLGEDGQESGEGYILPIEGYKLPFPSSSSSTTCIHDEHELVDSETTTTRADREGETLPFPAELESSRRVLLDMGCSPAAAVTGLDAAVARGLSDDQIEACVDGWCVYCASDKGSSIRAPGFLSAKRVGQGVEAPGLPEESRDEKAARYLSEMLGDG